MPRISLKSKQEKALEIYNVLCGLYPNVRCMLNYTKDYELLFAARLSAQCTDKRVNIITKDLFKKYITLEDFANADFSELEEIIYSCGLSNSKARDIIKCANQLINNFGGKVPDNMKDLASLAGVGRKTANLMLAELYKKSAVITDTHFIRLCQRMGFTKEKVPKKVEDEMRKVLITPEYDISAKFCHLIVSHGREYCKAQNPNCTECPLECKIKK